MRHIEFCLDEITAEIVTLFDVTEQARALQQLDEREARGEILTVVDAVALRRHLTEAITNHSLMQALQTVGELRRLIAGAAPHAASAQSATILPFRKPDRAARQKAVAQTSMAVARPPEWNRYRELFLAACMAVAVFGLSAFAMAHASRWMRPAAGASWQTYPAIAGWDVVRDR